MYNILICDDQPDIVNALKIYLTPEGYRLSEAFTGLQALEIMEREDIHLVLLDIMKFRQLSGISTNNIKRRIVHKFFKKLELNLPLRTMKLLRH